MARNIVFFSVFIAFLSSSIALDESSTPDRSKKSAKDAFEQSGLAPKYVSSGPAKTLDVVYVDNNADTYVVQLGNQLKVENTLEMPVVSWDAETDALYTLIMFDPDAPTPSTSSILSPFLHWIVINIPNNDLEHGNFAGKYISPNPLVGPAHRYTLVLYKQAGIISDNFRKPGEREKFSIIEFTTKRNMTGPIAGNFFYEQILGPL